MPYTTQGFMTAADLADHRQQTDTGVTTIDLADPPEWFDTSRVCPVCPAVTTYADHEAVTVADTSGDAFRCLPIGADTWQELPDEPLPYY